MAKDRPQVAAAQYKVLLKPTDVGLLVLKRMERPHLDKSAELRRLIELGYAAEQAGFILDGTVLRHAGRAWDTQPALFAESGAGLSPGMPVKEQPATGQANSAKGENRVDPSSVAIQQGESQADANDAKSALQSNLRSLSV